LSLVHQAVLWNRQKKLYDLTVAAICLVYLALFVAGGAALFPAATIETLVIRGFGTLAFLLLHLILAIGPLCRLNPRFLPLLYNRRHLGVVMFFAALIHGTFATIQFHGFGHDNPLASLLASGLPGNVPFEQFGLAAIVILFLMAATSHDFWLHALTPRIWKSLHMAVYGAYALVVAHVAFGSAQAETSPLLATPLLVGLLAITTLHMAAARRESAADEASPQQTLDGFVPVCPMDDIAEGRAKVVSIGGERIAIFRHQGHFSALSNVCRHQNGPLGEGRIINGCVTCPWHGYQYHPATGISPPPFKDRVPTYRTRVEQGRVYVHPEPCKPHD